MWVQEPTVVVVVVVVVESVYRSVSSYLVFELRIYDIFVSSRRSKKQHTYIYVEAVICYSIYSLTPVVPLICRTLEDGSIGGGEATRRRGNKPQRSVLRREDLTTQNSTW